MHRRGPKFGTPAPIQKPYVTIHAYDTSILGGEKWEDFQALLVKQPSQ